MKIYNNFTLKKESVNLNKPIGIYVCGITPYDTTHLGHAFTFITYDVLVRYLRFAGAKVSFVQNVTDIDDDILMRAKKLNLNWKTLAVRETKKYLGDMKNLNMLPFDHFPKATENIEEILDIVKVLIKQGFAYTVNGSVYFEVKKYKNFGKLCKLDYPAMLALANERGNYPEDQNKKDPLDFILWQAHKEDEPYWQSPWGKGRPGWHIECSAMSMKFLGKTITIHGGGEDLIFPHHEAEIAQSENYSRQQFVKIWMHAAMVYCGEKKMSKSLGNMIFVSDLLLKYHPNVIRVMLLNRSYKKAWNYCKEEIEKAVEITSQITPKKGAKVLNYTRLKKTFPAIIASFEDDFKTEEVIQSLVKIAKEKTKYKEEILTTAGEILGLQFS